jgi:hypothetical protein
LSIELRTSESRTPDRDDRLRAAFLATSYGTSSERFTLTPACRPLPPSPLFASGARWAILTAHNPEGRRQSAHLNEAAQSRLQERLSAYPLRIGVNGEGAWSEASLLVAGLPLRSALQLGQEFAQVAVLYGVGQRAALVWCASGRAQRLWMSAVPSKG